MPKGSHGHGTVIGNGYKLSVFVTREQWERVWMLFPEMKGPSEMVQAGLAALCFAGSLGQLMDDWAALDREEDTAEGKEESGSNA